MTTIEAARELGVTPRQVERMVASGALALVSTVGRSFLLDRASVRQAAVRGTRRGRAWSQAAIWSTVDLLDGGRAPDLTAGDRSRLRARLRSMTAADVVQALKGRAVVARYAAVGSATDAVRGEVALTGVAAVASSAMVASRFGLAQGDESVVDGYVSEDTADRLVRDYVLWKRADGHVVLRVLHPHAPPSAVHASIASDTLVALDLTESLSVRERSAGLRYLTHQLAALR